MPPQIPSEDTSRFPGGPGPWPVYSPRWRRQQESNLHGPFGPSRGSSPISTPMRVSRNGGRRSIETQERQPLICFRGSDRLPACYTFQNHVPVRAYFARRNCGVYRERLYSFHAPLQESQEHFLREILAAHLTAASIADSAAGADEREEQIPAESRTCCDHGHPKLRRHSRPI